MDVTRLIFLGLTVAALAFPVRRMILWLSENGLDTGQLVTDLSANAPAMAAVVMVDGLAKALPPGPPSPPGERHDPPLCVCVWKYR